MMKSAPAPREDKYPLQRSPRLLFSPAWQRTDHLLVPAFQFSPPDADGWGRAPENAKRTANGLQKLSLVPRGCCLYP